MDPVTITAVIASFGGIVALLKPLFKTFLEFLYTKSQGRKPNIEISITGADGSIKSIKLDSFASKSLSETEIKKLIKLLEEATDAETEAS